MTDADVESLLEGIVHADTQAVDRGFDLTVASIARVEEPGRVDFGGGELEPAATTPVEPEQRHPADDYGWWDLPEGGYLLSYNERLAEPATLVVQPRDALLERGAAHPTLHRTDLGPVPLSVAAGGISLKENARVSTVVSARTDQPRR